MKPIRILLADDHDLVRAGIRSLLQNLPDVDVIAEANDGNEALNLIEQKHPDLVLMDIAMPGLNGLETTRRVAKEFPQVRVIILSMHAIEEYVIQALRAGARGYLLKDSNVAELELAIHAVMRDETYLSPAVSKHITEYIRQFSQPSPLEQLTPRQREIMQLLAEGHSTQEIADILHISPKTVATHREQIMERLDIHDLASLVRYSVRMGLVPPGE